MKLGTVGVDPSLAKPWSLEQQLQDTARFVGQHLDEKFPGYPWYVRCDAVRVS